MKKYLILVSILLPLMLFLAVVFLSVPRTAKEAANLPGYDFPNEAQEHFLKKRVPFGETSLPTERYLVASQQMQKMPVYSVVTNSFASALNAPNLGSWTALGPGNIGGRTRALIIDPTNPNTMYAGGVAGGIWKTTDGGGSWSAKGDLLPNIAVSCLARAANGTLYAGTGESFASAGVRGAGIYQSTDAGNSWIPFAGTTTDPNFLYVSDIVVSPSNPQVTYVATTSGVFQFTKGGSKRKQVVTEGPCYDLAIRTDLTTDYIYAAVNNKIYRSTTGGGVGSWSIAYTFGAPGRCSLAIAPSNQNYIYALSAFFGGVNSRQLQAVISSTNGGNSWSTPPLVTGPFSPTNLNTYLLSNPYTSGCFNNPAHQGDYDNAIAVDPTNPSVVWAGGVDLFRSDNGGVNWGVASYWWTGGSHFVHADQHTIVFHPNYNGTSNTTMYVGNDGGIFRTTNALDAVTTSICSDSGSAINWTSLNNGYGVTQFYHGLPHPNGTTYFGGTQDNGTIEGSDSSGGNWGRQYGGDGGYVAISPSGDTRYGEYQFGNLLKATGGGGFSTIGQNGINEGFTCPPNSQPISLPFITTFVMDPNNEQRLWLGGTKMWRTDNGAGNWSQAHASDRFDVENSCIYHDITAIAVAQGNSNVVFAGTRSGNIFRTSNGDAASASAVTWTTPIRLRRATVTWIALDPSNSNTVYVTYSNFNDSLADQHVYKSTNGGASWIGIDGSGSGGIPDVPVHCIVVDPTNSQRLFVGSDVGVFVSVNGGSTWNRENSGFANVITESLAIGNRAGVPNLFAFTHGRGAWRVPLGSSGGGGSPPTPPSSLTATPVSSSQINLNWVDNSSNETGFRIERGFDGVNFSLVTNVAANQTSYENTGLAASTRYYYRVKALNSTTGDSGFSNTTDATTLAAGSSPPAPSNLSATASSSMQINLSWQDNSSNELGFRIERKPGSAGTFSEIATVGVNATSYIDTAGVQPSTTYTYRLRAYNTFGNSPYSSEASATTPGGGGGGNPCLTVSLLSGTGQQGYAEGVAGSAQWNGSRGGVVAKHPLSGFKTLFIADTDNNMIRLVYLEGPNNGKSEWVLGTGVAGYKGGSNANRVKFNAPMGIGAATDTNGVLTALIVADTNNHVIRKILPPPSSGALWVPQDFVGEPGVPGNDPDHFRAPQAVVVTSDGFIYVADTDNNLIRKISPQGSISTILNGASVGMSFPTGITANQGGPLVLYIADTSGNSIWQVTASGTATKIAGSGSPGFLDGTGTAAQFNKPYHLVYCNTASGEMLLIADRVNHRIRKLMIASSVVSTVAGSTAGYQEGSCTSARFSGPRGAAAFNDGIVYIMDTANHRIRKIQ
jgi:hypothetical protein